MDSVQKTAQLRSFGLTVGGVFLIIGIWPLLWSGEEARIWAVGIGSILVFFGAVRPAILGPIYRGWMAFAHVLGRINTRIILGIFFFAILTPIGVLAKLMGKQFLFMNMTSGVETYRVPRGARPVNHVRHQF